MKRRTFKTMSVTLNAQQYELHVDGTVYERNRFGTLRRVKDQETIRSVYKTYELRSHLITGVDATKTQKPNTPELVTPTAKGL